MMVVNQKSVLVCALVAVAFVQLVSGEESQVSTVSYHTLQKAVSNFEAVLVKFDESYPSKSDLDKEFKQLAQDLRFSSDLLVAEVKVPYRGSDVKDEDVSEERRLAEKLNAHKTEDFPVVYLFKKGQFDSPILFETKDSFDANLLRQFVRSQVPNIRLVLESCIATLDDLAAKFVKREAADRKAILKEAQAALEKLSDDKKQAGKVYLKLMERVVERGDMFLQSERERIKNLLSGQMSEQKKKQLKASLNILESFQTAPKKKEEL